VITESKDPIDAPGPVSSSDSQWDGDLDEGEEFGAGSLDSTLDEMATVLVASDAPTLRREIAAAIEGPDLEVLQAKTGQEALQMIRSMPDAPDLLIVDMQMGSMGAMAVALELSLEESYLDVEHISVLMLLDRRPDVFLARRSKVEGWLVKPLDPLRLRRATRALIDGGTYHDETFVPTPVLVGAGNTSSTLGDSR
jgi:CheY-like chemotaxis protein